MALMQPRPMNINPNIKMLIILRRLSHKVFGLLMLGLIFMGLGCINAIYPAYVQDLGVFESRGGKELRLGNLVSSRDGLLQNLLGYTGLTLDVKKFADGTYALSMSGPRQKDFPEDFEVFPRMEIESDGRLVATIYSGTWHAEWIAEYPVARKTLVDAFSGDS